MSKKSLLELQDFPLHSFDKLRYADTDRQGHVNNANFSTFLETGRVEFIYQADLPILSEQTSFVVAAMDISFLREVKWPGRVEIGTALRRIGNSSISVYQQIFQYDQCVASAETVIVQVDNTTGKAQPLTEPAKTTLRQWLLSN
ncbi:MAG TPA: thioesterase family protein [Saprospiraceae bacterium]|nr:thioesterase family protein [Saprospiraceae bacterium]